MSVRGKVRHVVTAYQHDGQVWATSQPLTALKADRQVETWVKHPEVARVERNPA